MEVQLKTPIRLTSRQEKLLQEFLKGADKLPVRAGARLFVEGSPLDNLAFSLRMVLRGSNLSALDDEGTDALAEDLSAYLRDNEGWRYNEGLKRHVRMEVYKCLLPHIQPFDASRANTIVDNLLKMQRITA